MMRDLCGITGIPCSQCTPCCEHVKPSLVNSRYAAEHDRRIEVGNIASVYEEMMAEDNAAVMTEADIEGPAVKRCGEDVRHCASARKDRGSVLEEASSVINGERLNVYGYPENSFELIGIFWELVDMADPEMSMEAITALKMALMKVARILSNPKDRDSWRDAAGYIGLGCDMACAEDIEKDLSEECVA